MSTRALLLALLLAPLLLLGGIEIRHFLGSEKLLPGLGAPSDVARVEIVRDREQVILARRKDSGAWEILSAADAPADAARIEAAITRLAALRGQPVAPDAPPPRRAPLQVRLIDREGNELGHAAFWTGAGQALPDGRRLALATQPALPLWPSAWTTLVPPVIDPGDVAAAQILSADGAVELSLHQAVAVAEMLGGLSAQDFQGSASVNWAGARQIRVLLADGSSIDLQQVSDGDGRYFLRMTSDSRTDIREARRFAFRVSESLP
ncbi:MAG: hypothetical protein KGZ61_10775 [Sandarakinorhabdus sp.]|nr:hypothetical protein [Sandarakinorhabdus sp.]